MYPPDVYPRYGFGWIVPEGMLGRLVQETTGEPCGDAISYSLKLFREASCSFSAGEHDYWPVVPYGKLTTLLYIASNESPEKYDLASNKEFVERAKAALGQTEDARWYHMDLF